MSGAVAVGARGGLSVTFAPSPDVGRRSYRGAMSSMQYYVAQSLDGFIADRDDRIDWLLAFGFEVFQESYDRFFAGVGAIVMGAGTLRFLVESGEPWAYPGLPTWVMTHGDAPAIDGADIRVVADDPARVARESRAAAGDRAVWVVGGGATAAQLADLGELDELIVTIMPVTLGSGARLLPTIGAAHAWRLEGSTACENGAVELRYRRRSED